MWETLHYNGGWDCFRTLTLLEIFKNSKSTSKANLCIFGSHTFVPTSWMCNKQTSVSHRVNGIWKLFLLMQICAWTIFPLLIFGIWLLKCCILLPTNQINPKENVQGNLLHDTPSREQTKSQVKTPIQYNDLELCNVDYVSSNVKSCQSGAMLYIFEDHEAVIKMIIKDKSSTMRHVSRTHRVALDWLFDRIYLDPKIQIKYVDTKNQLAHCLTKDNFTRDECNNLLHLFSIASCPEVMSKRMQQETEEERIVAKSKPTLNLTSNSAELECIQ